jgi:hypothetical protein
MYLLPSFNSAIADTHWSSRGKLRIFPKIQTPIAEGQRIHYNFVKPHQALEGQTPAERAGIGVEARNKWLAMLTKAVNNTDTTSPS